MKNRPYEFLLFSIVALVLIVFSQLPNWAGWSAQDAEMSFNGIYFDAADYSVHIAAMESGIQGNWLYQLLFTTENQKPAAIKLFYILLGHISNLFKLPAEVTYQISIWTMGYLALFSIFFLCKLLFRRKVLYWSAFFLAVMGSGLGWLQLSLGWTPGPITPIDFWLIDAYVFFSISLFPHFSFQIAMLALSLYFYLKFLGSHRWEWILAISVACLLVEMVNPISLVVLDVAIFICTLFQDNKNRKSINKSWLAVMVIIIIQVPLFFYNIKILTQDPIYRQFSAQNLTLSPPLIYYLLGFGSFWPFVLIGSIRAWNERNGP